MVRTNTSLMQAYFRYAAKDIIQRAYRAAKSTKADEWWVIKYVLYDQSITECKSSVKTVEVFASTVQAIPCTSWLRFGHVFCFDSKLPAERVHMNEPPRRDAEISGLTRGTNVISIEGKCFKFHKWKLLTKSLFLPWIDLSYAMSNFTFIV